MYLQHINQTAVRNHTNVINNGNVSGPPGVEIRVEIKSTSDAAANACAAWLAARIQTLSAAQSTVSLAFSGGKTPEAMLTALAHHNIPWGQIHIFQVDERCVPLADPRRNAHQLLTTLQPVLASHGVADHLHLLPVPDLLSPDLLSQVGTESAKSAENSTASPKHRIAAKDAVAAATETFRSFTGGILDIVHLGLGDDGHTASLVPGDSVLQSTDADIAVTAGSYQGTQRMTLTYPALQRARALCWLATGPTKAPMIARMLAKDPTIPAGALGHHAGVVFCDAAASPWAQPNGVSTP